MNSPRFLVIRFRAIGDCVMCTWAASSIRQKYPEAYIAWAVEDKCADVIDTHRLVNHLQVFPRSHWKKERAKIATWREQIAYYTSLRKDKFDFGIDLHGHSKTALALRLAAPKKRVAAYATDAFARSLNPVPIIQPPLTHAVDHAMNVLRNLGDFPTVDMPIMPEPPQVSGLPDGQFISICTGGSSNRKRYSPEHWNSVGKILLDQGIPVVVIGGPGDPEILDPRAINFPGKLTLKESMRIIKNSSVHIAPDTGTGHIAAAMGVPIVSLFGNAYHPAEVRPYSEKLVLLQVGEHPDSIPPELVARSAIEFLGR